MVLRPHRRTVCAAALVVFSFAGITGTSGTARLLAADDKPRPGEVSLPLKDYLALAETAERVQKEKARQAAQREAPVAEVTAQRVSLVVGKDAVDVASELDVLVQGAPVKPVFLPFSGYPAQAEVKAVSGGLGEPAAVTAVKGGGGVVLVAPAAGKYTVKVAGRAHLDGDGGIQSLTFAPVVAPVAATEVELPADLAWSCPGAVVEEDRVQGGRRHLRLASRRGEKQVLELRRKIDSAEAEKLLAQTVVLTLFQLHPEGPRRHDVILYEVSRGSLGSFTVTLPPGLEVDQAGTDEGTVVPVVENGTLTVHRQRRLQGAGIGYLVLTSTPAPEALAQGVPLAAVRPEFDVRSRYLAISSSVAADTRPLPEKAWSRVDLTDLPQALSEALTALDLTAAWRLSEGAENAEIAGARLVVTTLPAAPRLDATVVLRETTTLMTVDGTLLHRDRFVLDSRSRAGAAFDLVLPAGATLWSAKVDDQPVRPLEHGGTVSVPLGFESGARAVVEIVAVLERAIPAGRSQLAFELPQVRLPVVDHRWKLLLPEGPSYRFHRGDLRPVANKPGSREPWAILSNTPGVLTDRINVGGNETGQQSQYVGAAASALAGRVIDEQGSALPGVTMTLTGAGLPKPVVQISNAQGTFQMTGLPGGVYSVKAELEGFSTIEYPAVTLTAGTTTSVELILSAAVEDVVTVLGEAPLLDERRTSNTQSVPINEPKASYRIGSGRKDKKKDQDLAAAQKSALFAQEAQGLQQGLVGGVKPLPISIPESGKVLLLTGVLPPSRVAVELDVKAKRKGWGR